MTCVVLVKNGKKVPQHLQPERVIKVRASVGTGRRRHLPVFLTPSIKYNPSVFPYLFLEAGDKLPVKNAKHVIDCETARIQCRKLY